MASARELRRPAVFSSNEKEAFHGSGSAAAFARVDDDDDFFDSEIYDPAYYPRKVVRDGKGIRVRGLSAMRRGCHPRRMPDASMHRPHQISSATALNCGMRSARRHAPMRSATTFCGTHGARGTIRRRLLFGTANRRATSTSSASPTLGGRATCRNDPADDVEALQRRWASPGATPGPGRRPAQDAAPVASGRSGLRRVLRPFAERVEDTMTTCRLRRPSAPSRTRPSWTRGSSRRSPRTQSQSM